MASFFGPPNEGPQRFCASTQYLAYFIPIHLLFCWNDVNLYLSGLKWRTVGPFRPWNVSSYALACGLQWHFVGWAKKPLPFVSHREFYIRDVDIFEHLHCRCRNKTSGWEYVFLPLVLQHRGGNGEEYCSFWFWSIRVPRGLNPNRMQINIIMCNSNIDCLIVS